MKSSNPNYTIYGFNIIAEEKKEILVNILLVSILHSVDRDVDIARYFFSTNQEKGKAFAELGRNNIEVEIEPN